MSKNTDLAKNTAIIGVGKITSQFIGFALLPLYTIFLTPGEFGVVDLVITYIGLLVPLVTLQINRAAFRNLIDARGNEYKTTQIISGSLAVGLGAILVVAAVLGLASLWIAIPYVLYILLAVIANVLNTHALQYVRGMGNNKVFAIASIVAGLATLAGALLFVVSLRMGAPGILLTMAISGLLSSGYAIFAMRLWKHVRIDAINKDVQKDMLGFSMPLVPSGISWWAIGAADRTIITAVLGVAANGIYAISNRYAAIFMALYSIFEMSWTESASMHITKKDRDIFFSRVANASVRIFGSLGLLIIVGFALLFPILVSAQFAQSYQYLPIMIIAALLNSMVGIYSSIYIAKKLTRKVLSTSLLAAAISVSVSLVGVHLIGLYGAALAAVVAYATLAIMRHKDTQKYVKVRYDKGIFIKLALAYVIVLGLYYLNNTWINVANVAIALVIAFFMNQDSLGYIKKAVLSKVSKRKKLTSEQAVFEEIVEDQEIDR